MMPFSEHEYKNNCRQYTVNTATAQNATAGTPDTSNMTTFEENMTAAGNGTAGGMSNLTG